MILSLLKRIYRDLLFNHGNLRSKDLEKKRVWKNMREK